MTLTAKTLLGALGTALAACSLTTPLDKALTLVRIVAHYGAGHR